MNKNPSFVPVSIGVCLCLVACLSLWMFTGAPRAARASDGRDVTYTRPELDTIVIGHPDGTLVRVEGEADVTAVPDLAVTDARFVFEAPRADDAARDVDERVERYIRALGRLGIPDDRIQLVGSLVRPRFDFTDNRGRDPRVAGYFAATTVRVRSDVDQLDNVVDEAFNTNVNGITRLVFEIADEEGAFLSALSLATERARGRADAIARSLGGTVVGIVEVREPEARFLEDEEYVRTGVEGGVVIDGLADDRLVPGERVIRASVEFAAVIKVN